MEKVTKYVRFSYDLKDQDLIDTLDECINNHAEEIFDFFDTTLPRTLVSIKIISTKSEYDEVVKKRRNTETIPSWEIGNCHDGIIEYVSFHDYNNTTHAFPLEKYNENLEYYKKTIIHEYVHFVVSLYINKNNADKPMRYLNEGVAQYLSHQRDNENLIFTNTYDEIINSNNCYLGWFLLAKFIIEEKGKDYFLMLLKNRELALSEASKLYNEAKEFYDDFNMKA